jgi:hypothetical protein
MENRIYILQNLISDEHQDAMFYSGIIAVTQNKINGKYLCLTTRNAEIIYNNKKYVGQEINNLAAFYVICDVDIEKEVDVLVDGFFYIAEFNTETLTIQTMEEVIREFDSNSIFNTYDEAIHAFTKLVK